MIAVIPVLLRCRASLWHRVSAILFIRASILGPQPRRQWHRTARRRLRPWKRSARSLMLRMYCGQPSAQGVNLRLKLDDVGVAVSVSYRDGEIRATFHADSPELRNALSTAWEKHVFSISDQKPYRFAEPVFSSSNTSSNSEQGSFAQGYSMGGDSSRQSSQQAQRGNPDVIRRSRPSISSVGAPVAPSQAAQVSGNSSRLQAFA
jgi:hypothetical protein